MDAAHVQLDDTTLDAAYTSVRQIVTDNSSRTSTLETEMEVVQGQIDQRIWKTDIRDATDPLGTQITQISDRYATQQQTIAWALLRGRLFLRSDVSIVHTGYAILSESKDLCEE